MEGKDQTGQSFSQIHQHLVHNTTPFIHSFIHSFTSKKVHKQIAYINHICILQKNGQVTLISKPQNENETSLLPLPSCCVRTQTHKTKLSPSLSSYQLEGIWHIALPSLLICVHNIPPRQRLLEQPGSKPVRAT